MRGRFKPWFKTIFQDSDRYNKESFWEKVRDLRGLTLEKSAKIVEELVTSQLGRNIIEANRKWSKK
ncbi:MAG: hypothetical protein AB1297_07050 [bacterium]